MSRLTASLCLNGICILQMRGCGINTTAASLNMLRRVIDSVAAFLTSHGLVVLQYLESGRHSSPAARYPPNIQRMLYVAQNQTQIRIHGFASPNIRLIRAKIDSFARVREVGNMKTATKFHWFGRISPGAAPWNDQLFGVIYFAQRHQVLWIHSNYVFAISVMYHWQKMLLGQPS